MRISFLGPVENQPPADQQQAAPPAVKQQAAPPAVQLQAAPPAVQQKLLLLLSCLTKAVAPVLQQQLLLLLSNNSCAIYCTVTVKVQLLSYQNAQSAVGVSSHLRPGLSGAQQSGCY